MTQAGVAPAWTVTNHKGNGRLSSAGRKGLCDSFTVQSASNNATHDATSQCYPQRWLTQIIGKEDTLIADWV